MQQLLRKRRLRFHQNVKGSNTSPEPFARGFTHGFTIDFRDAAARDAYLEHEAHQRAGAKLVAALEGGTDGLMVFDLEIA
ncbi:Dabb family protein [Mesorhizobium sp. M0998]|uniref:Dabb family protein n=1 Tax=Mesorhizobium sp. M0998 TaxID=2957044 RepID=UPI00333590F2